MYQFKRMFWWGFDISTYRKQMFEYEDMRTSTSTLRSHTALASGFGWPSFIPFCNWSGAWKRLWTNPILYSPSYQVNFILGYRGYLSRIVATKSCRWVVLWKDSISDVFASCVILETCPRNPTFSRQPTIIIIDDFWLKFDQHQIEIVHKTQKSTCFFNERKTTTMAKPIPGNSFPVDVNLYSEALVL